MINDGFPEIPIDLDEYFNTSKKTLAELEIKLRNDNGDIRPLSEILDELSQKWESLSKK